MSDENQMPSMQGSTYAADPTISNPIPSPALNMSTVGWKKTGKTFLFALAGFILTWLGSNLANMNFGTYTGVLMVFLPTLIKAGEQYLLNQPQ